MDPTLQHKELSQEEFYDFYEVQNLKWREVRGEGGERGEERGEGGDERRKGMIAGLKFKLLDLLRLIFLSRQVTKEGEDVMWFQYFPRNINRVFESKNIRNLA